MSSNPDYQQRAAEFLKAWQEQMTRQMSDPDTIRAMLAAMQSYGAPPHDAHARRPADAPDARHDAIGDVAKRLRALEQSVARLHARLDAAEKPARAKRGAAAKPVAKRRGAVATAQRATAKPKRKLVAKSGKRKK